MDGELLFNSSDVVDHGHGAHIWTKQAEKLEWEAWQDPAIVFSAEQVRKRSLCPTLHTGAIKNAIVFYQDRLGTNI
jgi:hypothetical protein